MTEEKKETKDQKDTREIKDDKGMPEWLAPILSALGSMGGSYMLWIKPIQDRADTMARQINEMQMELKELMQQNKELAEQNQELANQVNRIQANQANEMNGYLPIKKSIAQGSYFKKRI